MTQISKWGSQEVEMIQHVRNILGDELLSRPQFPEVVGDRRILRFIRGYGSVEKASKMMSKFLKWRIENNVDKIRQDIVYNGKNHPKLFPHGQVILKLVPQIIISKRRTKNGSLISTETFNFSPKEVLSNIKIEEYLEFLIYSLGISLTLII